VQTPIETHYPIPEATDRSATTAVSLVLAILTWASSVILLLVIPPILSLPYLIYQYRHGEELTRDTLLADKTFIFFNILGVIPAHVITFALAWGLVTRFGKLPFKSAIAWDWAPNFRFWKSAGTAIALLIVGILILSRFGGEPTDMEKIILSSRLNACVTAFLATATAPLVEEIVYRGILYSALQRVLGTAGSVLIVMSLFTIVHGPEYWPNLGILATILLLSFVLTLVRARTNRLLPCYVIHLIFNGIQSVVIVLGPYIPDINRLIQRQTSGAILLATLFGVHRY
jgi:uncharacterized protein